MQANCLNVTEGKHTYELLAECSCCNQVEKILDPEKNHPKLQA